MTQQAFVNRREVSWNEFEKMLKGDKKNLAFNAEQFPQRYRELTQDLNSARAFGFDPSIIERLNALVLDGSQVLYSRRFWSPKTFADYVLRTFPRAVRSQWRALAACLLIFYGLGAFFALLCIRHPHMAYQILGESMVTDLEYMYYPGSEHFLRPREVSSDADMFGLYIFNNVSIAFRTFAGGILAGFGSLFILSFNALFLGAATAHIINIGYGETFFPFVIAHGSFELTAIVFSAQAGLLLGYSFFITKGLSRGASVRNAGKTALPIIAGAAIMLVIAAAIEAFWSSRHELPLALRYGAGAAMWVLVIWYFVFAGRRKDR